jgi:hypothetical protein
MALLATFALGILYGALIHRMLTEPVDDELRRLPDADGRAPVPFHSTASSPARKPHHVAR